MNLKKLAPLIQAALVFFAIIMIVSILIYSNTLSVRYILHARPPYIIPYQAHGATVYISIKEAILLAILYLLSVLLVVAQILLDRKLKKR